MGQPKPTGKTYQLRRVNQNQNKQTSNNAGSSSAMNTYDKLIDSDSEETPRITPELKPASGNIKKKQQKQNKQLTGSQLEDAIISDTFVPSSPNAAEQTNKKNQSEQSAASPHSGNLGKRGDDQQRGRTP